MAKAEGFKNKITKAQEDLFKAIDVEKGKKKVLSEKIVLELSKIEKANVRTLSSLNKEYIETDRLKSKPSYSKFILCITYMYLSNMINYTKEGVIFNENIAT